MICTVWLLKRYDIFGNLFLCSEMYLNNFGERKYCTVSFKRAKFSIEHEDRMGMPFSVFSPANIEGVRDKNLLDHRIWLKEYLHISYE